jgi:hypothetical protein
MGELGKYCLHPGPTMEFVLKVRRSCQLTD